MHENPRYDLRKVENWTKNNAPNVALQLGYVLNKRFIHAVEIYGKKLRKSHEEGGIVIYDYLPIFGNRFLKEYKHPLKRV